MKHGKRAGLAAVIVAALAGTGGAAAMASAQPPTTASQTASVQPSSTTTEPAEAGAGAADTDDIQAGSQADDATETAGGTAEAKGVEDGATGGDQTPAYASSLTAPQTDGLSESSEAAALQKSARIDADQASAAATAAVPGTATNVELDNENGAVVYSVTVETSSGTADVKVDAGNGAVLHQEADSGNESESGD